MRSLKIAAMVSIAAACLSAASDPFSGVWKLNLVKSKLPAPAVQSQTATIEADGEGIRIREEIVNDKGEHLTVTVNAKFDGKDYPVSGTPLADTVAYRRVDSRTIDGTAKKAGKVVTTERAVVSGDGKTLTVTYTGKDAAGKPVTGVGVFEKQ